MKKVKLETYRTKLDKVLLIKPCSFFDDFRGMYVETYNRVMFKEAGIDLEFIEDDFCISQKGVLRGIHGSKNNWKLTGVTQGKVYQVVVNYDPTHPQFKQWTPIILSDESRFMALIPPMFGNSYLVLSNSAIYHYKQTRPYSEEDQFALKWNDPELNIWWPIKIPILSQRDE